MSNQFLTQIRPRLQRDELNEKIQCASSLRSFFRSLTISHFYRLSVAPALCPFQLMLFAYCPAALLLFLPWHFGIAVCCFAVNGFRLCVFICLSFCLAFFVCLLRFPLFSPVHLPHVFHALQLSGRGGGLKVFPVHLCMALLCLCLSRRQAATPSCFKPAFIIFPFRQQVL